MKKISDYTDVEIKAFRILLIILSILLILISLPFYPAGIIFTILGLILLFISHSYKKIIKERKKATSIDNKTK